MVGLEFEFMNYGTKRRREPFSTTIPDVTVEVETTNNFALGHLLARLQPNSGSIRPYVEGAVGFHHLFTNTTIKNQEGEGEEIASSTNLDDTAFSIDGGVMMRVWEKKPDDEEEENPLAEALIDLRLRYLSGGDAQYLRGVPSVVKMAGLFMISNGPKPTFFPHRSPFRLHSNPLPGIKPSMFTGVWEIVILVSKKQQNYTSPVVRTDFDSPLHTLNTPGGITL